MCPGWKQQAGGRSEVHAAVGRGRIEARSSGYVRTLHFSKQGYEACALPYACHCVCAATLQYLVPQLCTQLCCLAAVRWAGDNRGMALYGDVMYCGVSQRAKFCAAMLCFTSSKLQYGPAAPLFVNALEGLWVALRKLGLGCCVAACKSAAVGKRVPVAMPILGHVMLQVSVNFSIIG